MMRFDLPKPDLFVQNRRRLAEVIREDGMSVLQSNDLMPTNADGVMGFRQNSDLFYLCGIDQEETVLLIFPNANQKEDREILFIKKTTDQIAIWEGSKLSKEKAAEQSGICRVEWIDQFEPIFQKLQAETEAIYLNANEHSRAAHEVETREKRFESWCREQFPKHRYLRLAPLMHQLRVRKSELEIEQIRTACILTGKVFRRVLETIRPGIGEWEIEAAWIYEFIRNRSRGFAYQPIVASGENSCILHYVENRNRCLDGNMVLMDVGCEWNNWNSDLTRTVPVNGRFTTRQRAVYESVLRIMKRANSILRPGIFLKDYQRQVLNFVEEELIVLGLISQIEVANQSQEEKPLVKQYFMHGVSHHLGLDVHDVSPEDTQIEAGMVLTIEPGIYLENEQLGIRLENNIVVRETENENLTANAPIDPDEIEALMNP